jgi:hypothetical protein
MIAALRMRWENCFLQRFSEQDPGRLLDAKPTDEQGSSSDLIMPRDNNFQEGLYEGE